MRTAAFLVLILFAVACGGDADIPEEVAVSIPVTGGELNALRAGDLLGVGDLGPASNVDALAGRRYVCHDRSGGKLPAASSWKAGTTRKRLIAFAAFVALVSGCSDDPIDSARTCSILEVAKDEARFHYGDDQEAFDAEVLPRYNDRKRELGCLGAEL